MVHLWSLKKFIRLLWITRKVEIFNDKKNIPTYIYVQEDFRRPQLKCRFNQFILRNESELNLWAVIEPFFLSFLRAFAYV